MIFDMGEYSWKYVISSPDFPCECRLTVRAGSLIPFSLQGKGSWPGGFIYTSGLMPRQIIELTPVMNNLTAFV
jgi:hypothetical protein